MTTILIAYAVTGLVAGFLAGMLGIGGGLIIVPVLAVLFTLQGYAPEVVMPLALGTSLAAIIFTSATSMYVHHSRGAVDWSIVKRLLPGIALGSMLGSLVVTHIPPDALRFTFVAYAALVAAQMLTKMQLAPARRMPGLPGMIVAGGAVGGVSMLVGVAGASIAVPFMLWSNVPARIAIGTAAAIGMPVALASTIGYVGTGALNHNLPEYSFGFVHLPALAALVTVSMVAAPLGAGLSQRVPVAVLKKAFAGVLLATAGKMLLA